MITVRRGKERGHANFGWLDSWHTFSFGNYYDPQHMGFSDLRVINEDRVLGGEGFPSHSHRDMEIVSYVLEGALAHKDSTGSGGVIRYGDVQRMSAGRGVTHSEMNGSRDEKVHFLQIWLLPERAGMPASYEEKRFEPEDKRGRLRLIASPGGSEGSLTIHQDARLYASILEPGQEVKHTFASGRQGWVQVARGRVRVNGEELAAGDGAALSGEASVTLAGVDPSEILLFDLK
ncbi:MAG TPA: pirin family protein [Polyangia bacterium]|nr:pirin family protein [Polyangia bacterium]